MHQRHVARVASMEHHEGAGAIAGHARSRDEQRFLVAASELLASSLDYETTLTQVAQMAVPRLADICMVHLLDTDMTIRRLAIAHADPERQKLAQQLQNHGQLRMDDSWGVPVVLRTGNPVLYQEMPRAVWDIDQERPEHMAVIRALGMSSLMIVPLIAREQTIGTLAFVYSDSGRTYLDADLGMATALAGRAAIAIDNARLYREAREAETRFRTLVEQMPAIAYSAVADDLMSLTYISPQSSLDGGLDPEEILKEPRHWMSTLHPDDVAPVEEIMRACSLSGAPLSVEYRILSPDGEEHWHVDQAQLIRDETGTPLYWQGISVNITERKRSEDALRVHARQQAAVARLGQLALEDIDLPVFMNDAVRMVAETLEVEYVSCIRHDPRDDTVTVEAASGWSADHIRQTGIPLEPDSVTGYTLRSGSPVLVRDMAAETRFTGSQVMIDHGIVSALSVIIPGLPDHYGVLQLGSTRPRPFTDDDTNFLQAIGNLLAATLEHHRDEEEIRFHAHLLDVVNQAVVVSDEDGRISYWNHFAQELFGWSQSEVLGRNIHEVTPSDMSGKQWAEIEARLRDGESWIGSIELTRRDGSTFPAFVTDSPIHNAAGELIGIVGVSADMSAWTQAEAEREGLLRDLGERVKELTVLHHSASLLQNDERSVPEMLSEVAETLPRAMRFPGAASARVALGGTAYTSGGYRESPWSIRAEFSSERNVRGTIAVGYREECWGEGEPFLPEEVSLINTIADMLNGYFQRIATQDELHRSEARFRAAAEGGLDAFFILEALRSPNGELVDYLVIDANARGAEFAGIAREHLLDKPLKDHWRAHIMRPFYEMFEHVSLTGETVEREMQMDPSAAMSWLQCQVVPLANGVAVSVRDISDRKQLEEQLTHQAFHDALTGLPNRALFLDRVRHARGRVQRRQEGVAVLFMDLDNFKFVNDSLGHTVGDQLLVAVAGRLSDCLGKGGSAARLGGDEFAILLEDLTDWAVATETAEAIVSAFRAPFTIASREIFMSPSVGIAIGASLETTAEDLLRDADAAMYRAKRNGRARYEVFEPSLTEHALQRFELENDLRRAIERGEFVLHYQPIVHLCSGETIAFEALVRWEHPVHGLMPPQDFIPIAEDTGLIVPIGRWVLEEACQQVSAWNRQRAGMPPLELGVNISRRQFYDPELCGHLAAALVSSGLEPVLLKLEITESVMIEDESMASETLLRLKALGVELAIDDFGTGYSSLGMLRSFPVDVLKIDRGFVARLEAGSDDLVIVAGIISLAHALNLVVVAEGVETSQQLDHLKALGCDFAQGYLLGMPLPAQPGGPPAPSLIRSMPSN